jgi:hypothetical protein
MEVASLQENEMVEMGAVDCRLLVNGIAEGGSDGWGRRQ